MKHKTFLLLALLTAGAQSAWAQSDLTPQQSEGRRILTQNCNLCHLPQNPGANTYGPRLTKSSTNGDDNLMREVIMNGLVKMPGWKYSLSAQDINNVIAYVRTVPDEPPPAAARPAGG